MVKLHPPQGFEVFSFRFRLLFEQQIHHACYSPGTIGFSRHYKHSLAGLGLLYKYNVSLSTAPCPPSCQFNDQCKDGCSCARGNDLIDPDIVSYIQSAPKQSVAYIPANYTYKYIQQKTPAI